MGMKIDGKVHVDLDDLKRASGQIDYQAYPSLGESGRSVRDHVTFFATEPMPVRCEPSDVNEVCVTHFELTRHTVYECVGKRAIEMYDVWKHGDVIVRKIYTGTRYRDRYGMWT